MSEIMNDTYKAFSELLGNADLTAGNIVVLGCSTSEIMGRDIGKASYYNAGEDVIEGATKALDKSGIYLAVGCCEHLNRAVVIEREAAEKYALEQVAVVPAVTAGGSAGVAAYKKFKNPVMVEFVRAHAGIDIGGTFIGMHLKHVAVPMKLSVRKIGKANVTYAKTRPKYIGGERAVYAFEG